MSYDNEELKPLLRALGLTEMPDNLSAEMGRLYDQAKAGEQAEQEMQQALKTLQDDAADWNKRNPTYRKPKEHKNRLTIGSYKYRSKKK